MNHPQLKFQPSRREPRNPEPTSQICKQEVWLGIYFPDISLVIHQAPQEEPFAILERVKGRSQVYRANQAALAEGVVPGMQLNAAYALSQELLVRRRDTFQERRYLKACAQTVARFTPRIVLAGLDVLLLEVGASLRLFGGVNKLQQQLVSVIATPHILACAPVADAAELMARNGIGKVIRDTGRLQSALGTILLAGLPLEQKLIQNLHRCGLRTLQDMWRLPRPDLARRFGPELLRYLDQLSGQCPAPRHQFEADLQFSTKCEFEQETGNHQHLLRVAHSLLEQAGRFLQNRVLLAETIHFSLTYSPHRDNTRNGLRLQVQAQQGGDKPAHFLPQLTEILQKLELESPLIALELHISHFKPRSDSTGDIFKQAAGRSRGQTEKEPWPVLLNILFARLGHKRVYRLRLVADYRPEKAWSKRPVKSTTDKDSRSKKHHLVCTPERPAWLMTQPVKCSGQGFRLVSDAERLESGWWDGSDQRREYYQGIAPSGRRCWLFRDLYTANDQWYIHGLFA